MQLSVQVMAFLAAAYGLAIANWQFRNRRGLAGWLTLGFRATVLLTPLLIAPQHVMLRALACVLAIDLFFKITDYASQRSTPSDTDRSFPAYASFLVPFPVFLVRYGKRIRRRQADLSRWPSTSLALLAFVLCCAVLQYTSDASILRSSFLLDHTFKFVLFVFAIELLSRLLHGLEHLAGYSTTPLVDNAFLSQTVGEFWIRYNTRIHAWFDHNVFRKLNARRSPVRAVFLTFFISAVLHELGFAIATSKWNGYQFAFFTIQAPAVVLGRLAQSAATSTTVGAIVLRGATIVWMWATSMLFFHGVNRVIPIFYTAEPWLP